MMYFFSFKGLEEGREWGMISVIPRVRRGLTYLRYGTKATKFAEASGPRKWNGLPAVPMVGQIDLPPGGA